MGGSEDKDVNSMSNLLRTCVVVNATDKHVVAQPRVYLSQRLQLGKLGITWRVVV